jgi:NADPH-dependent 2,4-dienoyl-CoA reductase/sulfur reductase-like enzyme
MRHVDLVIIGGGPAGMAAAVAAYDEGVRDMLILEREAELGGILQQCIHSGFGVHLFKEELSGPAFAERFINLVAARAIAIKTQTMVIHIHGDRELEYVNPSEGYTRLKAKALILAMGCRERTRGAIQVPGDRPAGVWSAGTAQRYLNLEGQRIGERVFILGSGDIGLIMARRLSLEGAQVLGVAELQAHTNGLARNVQQCLIDFDIPLFLSHTIVHIGGRERVNRVTIAAVDENFKPISSTHKTFDVDTVLFSVGLIPENALSEEAGVELDPLTRGPIVDEAFQTSHTGVFACGNVVHVHDVVDYVAAEGTQAGRAAARYLKAPSQADLCVPIHALNEVAYVVPQQLHLNRLNEDVILNYRVKKPLRNVQLVLKKDGRIFKQWPKRACQPSEMQRVVLPWRELLDVREDLSLEIHQEELR